MAKFTKIAPQIKVTPTLILTTVVITFASQDASACIFWETTSMKLFIGWSQMASHLLTACYFKV
jgi:hypothetical protein